ncbi:hypothetical protein CDAR_507241 [Caerostris darwini]|uniref:Uncharacterized protein n=1 Tax=Caerostris darwini TaxID=1538125 RepID=A0AAV4WEI3_9ARAC|nr:hypothetical protein CDAR_507241 [Caerostris darwini]
MLLRQRCTQGARATSGAHTKSTFLVDNFSPEFPGGRERGRRSKSTAIKKYLLRYADFIPESGKCSWNGKDSIDLLGLTFEELKWMRRFNFCGKRSTVW